MELPSAYSEVAAGRQWSGRITRPPTISSGMDPHQSRGRRYELPGLPGSHGGGGAEDGGTDDVEGSEAATSRRMTEEEQKARIDGGREDGSNREQRLQAEEKPLGPQVKCRKGGEKKRGETPK